MNRERKESEKTKDAHRLKSKRGGEFGGRSRAKNLSPERRSQIARLGATARAKKYARPPLSALSADQLIQLLQNESSRTFTRPELRKIVSGFGYKLDSLSNRYWHPARPGWIALPFGKHGIVEGPVARALLRPLLASL